MGGELVLSDDNAAPSFLVYARRDPIGAILGRISIIKGWVDAEGRTQGKVFDVAWSDDREIGEDGKLPAVGKKVDLSIPSWKNDTGRAELGAVWTDPGF